MHTPTPTTGLSVRDASAADLPALQQLLGRATRLPHSEAGSQAGSEAGSEASNEAGSKAGSKAGGEAGDERLLLCHDAAGRLLATLRLRARIGLATPRCWFHLGLAVHAAPGLGLFRPQRTLQLGNDLTGAAELCDLALLPGQGVAMATLASAALQIARADAARWGAPVIAELPGLRDEAGDDAGDAAGDAAGQVAGDSPFWRGLGRHFFRGDPAEAEARLGPAWRSHLAALLPRQLIYASFLPDDAQAAMAQTGAARQPLRAALESAGFAWRQHLRIDDGGPVLEA